MCPASLCRVLEVTLKVPCQHVQGVRSYIERALTACAKCWRMPQYKALVLSHASSDVLIILARVLLQ